jgi:hypothetical protein
VKRSALAPTLALMLAIAAALWWWMNFEQVTQTTWVGLSGEARNDPHLAFKRLLAARGLKFEDSARNSAPDAAIAALPAGGTLVLLAGRDALMAPRRVDALLAWVSAGGHLVVASEPVSRPDPLLTRLGIGRELMRGPAVKDVKPGPMSRHVRVSLPGAARPLEIEMRAPVILKDANGMAEWHADDAFGIRLLSLKRQAGRVTVAADLGWIAYRGGAGIADPARQPPHIGKLDHAEAIIALARLDGRGPGAAVRMLDGGSALSLWVWLKENAWAALAGLGALLFLWLWRVVPRFGPLAPPEPAAELRLTSHLEASGRFYRRHLPIEAIHQGLARAFLQRLAERRPGIAARAAGQRNAELARLAGVEPQAVARALDVPASSAGDFVRSAILIKRMEQAL